MDKSEVISKLPTQTRKFFVSFSKGILHYPPISMSKVMIGYCGIIQF